VNRRKIDLSFNAESDKYMVIKAEELSRMSLPELIQFGETLGLPISGASSVGAAISIICHSAIEFKNIT
jgi:hypothetical protein